MRVLEKSGALFAIALLSDDCRQAPMMQTTMHFSVCREDPWSHDAQTLLDDAGAMCSLYCGVSRKSDTWFDDVCTARGGFFLARTNHGTPLGCGGFRRFTYYMAELAWVYSRAGTFGVGQTILSILETEAEIAGYRDLMVAAPMLNTRSIAFFMRNGYSFSSRPSMGMCQQGSSQYFVKSLGEYGG